MRKKKDPAQTPGDGARAITQSEVIVSQKTGDSNMSEYIEPASVPEHWVCDSDGKAKWICEQIKQIEDNRDYMIAWYKEQIEKAKKTAEFDRMKWESYLAAYFDTVPHKKANKSESYSFPGGKLVLKRQDPEYKKDETAVIEWLKANDAAQFVKTKEELNWADLKAACTGDVDGKLVFRETVDEDGVITQVFVPGIDVVYREDKFCVEVK